MSIYDRILITGAGGMLASALIKSVRERGYEPIALNRAKLDVSDIMAPRFAFKEHRPTLVLNCAAYTKVDLCEEQLEAASKANSIAPGVLAGLANECGARFVHYSTDFVFDGTSTRPYREDDTTNPLSVYGSSKLQGEKMVEGIGGDHWLILRTAWLYGPGGPCFPQTMINAAKAGKPLKVVDDQIGSPTFTHDLADATLNLLDADARGIYHIVNAGQTSWHDFTAAILEEFDLKTELSRTTSSEWKKLRPASATRPLYSVLDTSKYSGVTGKMMRPWRQGLAAYHQALIAG